ncbi:MAG TPA: phosphatase PAP2 family protein [Exilispira sp.]|nr:phosphatase PAP2 family protein [Exilispira sp.]
MNSPNLILFLQKINNDFLTYIMNGITFFGYEMGITLIICIYIFGVSFHKGFYILQATFWTFLTTDILKNTFREARPFIQYESIKNLDFSIMKEVQNGLVSFSFPSGHASAITPTMTSMALTIRKKWFTIVAVISVILVTLSRLYLGVHFPIDITAGIFLGLSITLLFYIPLKNELSNNSNLPFYFINKSSNLILFIIFFILLPFILLFIPVYFDKSNLGFLVGLNSGYLLMGFLYRDSKLEYSKGIFKALSRILIGISFYLISRFGLKALFGILIPEKLVEQDYFRITRYFLTGFLTVGLCVPVFIKLKLAFLKYFNDKDKNEIPK